MEIHEQVNFEPKKKGITLIAGEQALKEVKEMHIILRIGAWNWEEDEDSMYEISQ